MSLNGINKDVPRFGAVEVALAFVFLAALGLTWIFTSYAGDLLGETVDADFSNASQAIWNQTSSSYVSTFDSGFAMVYIFINLGLILSVFVIDTKPIFFIFMLVLMIISVFAVLEIANSYDDILTGDEVLGSYANKFTSTAWIASHMVESAIATIFMVCVALYAKSKSFG